MVEVKLGSTFSGVVNTDDTYQVEAANVIQMLRALEAKYPQLETLLKRGVAVAIDGQLYRDDWLQPIPCGAEVYLLPKVSGG